MKKIYLFSLLVATSLSYGQTFTASYPFTNVNNISTGNVDPTPPPVATGLTFGSFSAINPTAPTPYNSTSASRFSFANQPTGATDGNDINFTGAINTGIYYQVTITPNASVTYNLSNITFIIRRSANGIRNYVVRSSLDGYTSNLAASIDPVNANLAIQSGNVFFWKLDATANTNEVGSTITLGSPSFTGLTNPITFRFYAWNAETTTGTFVIDDVAISGSTGTLSLQESNISGLNIYPNPAKNNLYIASDSNEEKEVIVFNVLGDVVLNTKATTSPINISTLTAGVYMVKVQLAGKTATRKLVIE